MHDLSLWQMLGIWVAMTLLIIQAAAIAMIAIAAGWFIYQTVF